MTQTTPKQTDENANNVDSSPSKNVQSSKSVQVENRTPLTNEPPPTSPRQSVFFSLLKQLRQGWENFNFRTKLTVLLVGGVAVPVVAVTLGTVRIAQEQSIRGLEEVLRRELILLKEEIKAQEQAIEADANTLAKLVETAGIDVSNPNKVSADRGKLKFFLANGKKENPNNSFYIITDAQGRTVAQEIQVIEGDFSSYPPLPTEAHTQIKFRPVSLPPGIKLGDIPIVKNALSNGRSLAGFELLKGQYLQRLGLAKQANIGLRTQKIEGLAEQKKPFSEGTYDIDEGRAGFAIMAIKPIRVQGKVVGTAIVGTLMNRNYEIVDHLKEETGVSTATIFAKDWRVSTNVPYTDNETRAIGTRVSQEVAITVLNRKEDFIGAANIIGIEYLTGYSPIYDHQKELNSEQARPIGIAYVGTPQTEVKKTLFNLALAGYGLGGGILFLAGLVVVLVAGTFSKPLRRLAGFAKQVGVGEEGLRLEATERQDEIGILSEEMNQMVISLEAKEKLLRQDSEQSRLLAEITGARVPDQQALEKVLNKALDGARKILSASRVVIYRFNPDWSGYISNESVDSGWPGTLNDKIEDSCIPEQLIKAYSQERVVATNDVFEAGFHPDHMKLMERLQIKANLVVPILSQGQLFGLLIAHHCSNPHEWQESEINFLRQLSSQLRVILERISFNKQRRIEAKRAQILKDITLKMAGALDTNSVFDIGCRELRGALQLDRVIVYQFDETWKGTVIAESVAGGWPEALGAEIADPCFAEQYVEKYKRGRVQATPNIYEAGLTECHLKELEPFAVKANLVAPILTRGELLGLLIAHQCSSPRNWENGEIDLFAQLATQMGLALERANLLQGERIAQEEQRRAKEQLQQRALELLMEVDPVSQGNLTIRAKVTADEIGTIADSYNATIESLEKIVTQMKTAAEQVATTTSKDEVFMEALSEGALQQTKEISAALLRIQAMTESIRAVAANAQQAEAAVQQATQTVEAGDGAMNRTVEGILAIRETVAETAKKVKRLGESSQKISKVVNLISSFADQTNLLALNASIEAAHAGEEGRGFAVVADEVRSLARQSAEATAEIEALVASIQSETNEVVAAMEAGTEQVAVGTKLVDETRQSLNQIAAASAQIYELVEAIAQATVEQSQDSEAVTQTMAQVAAISDKTSAEATQISNSFKQLLAVAQQLQESVGKFKVG
ncbi:MAG: methyl-accepting chemotaxis protein [Xenococcaceae cyanobacterium]